MVGKPPRQREEWVLKILVSFLYNVLKGKLSVFVFVVVMPQFERSNREVPGN